jgi:hypothetical protein
MYSLKPPRGGMDKKQVYNTVLWFRRVIYRIHSMYSLSLIDLISLTLLHKHIP